MITQIDTAREALRRDPRIPLVIAALFIVLIIFNFIHMLKTLTLTQETRLTQLNAQHALRKIPDIAQAHLFGHYNQSLADLPPTRLQLTLQGIVLGISPGEESRVLIAAPHTPAKMYTVGEVVPGGAAIHHIFRDRVILLNDNGHLEELKLPIPKISGMVTSASP